ncbi:penicillin acylase family protein [Pseudoalteromonas sp. BDTF-M6]|uniref:penicillin acylase family protein n=1 Tax=Pseudoalteromonas sp. BDTF-M6 TaxID=2796132 RepID=UPI001BAFE5AC|nr:penicillin acylase family protein [Pseudoalteromonas sp. BDTF-M6]MBS3797081.1 penicillin acylase family protein [Pseudoalteromonas sp. BDTF-M6]
MLRWVQRLVVGVIILLLLGTAGVYGALSLSLPTLDGRGSSDALESTVTIKRDALGQAIIDAQSMNDAAYGLGFAHGQDRFFQMDLLRRNSAGELSELFGEAALELDKKMRFHQLRQRSERIFAQLPQSQQALLSSYSRGVNEAQQAQTLKGFEYLLSGAEVTPWQPEDSLLVIYSMYLDLQASNFERDMVLEQIERLYSRQMREFLTQPSPYQSALDGSEISLKEQAIPMLSAAKLSASVPEIIASREVGSNNWAVSGELTSSGQPMVADDMHLGLAVPIIWYRAQLNIADIQVTGVSLPGAPAIVVGSNDNIAWGFTNAYVDTSDWIRLDGDDTVEKVQETIAIAGGKTHAFSLSVSEYGPVQEVNGQRYALSWVGHYDYAVNLDLANLATAASVTQAFQIADNAGMPVQNLMVVDKQGQIGWQPMGAIAARTNPSDVALDAQEFQAEWLSNEPQRPRVMNPNSGRLWSANARVISTREHERLGDGGYALGARQQQIRDRLFAQSRFDEQAFLALQLDNEARFLAKWQALLVATLKEQGSTQNLPLVEQWQGCACADSIGYTMVRYFRSAVMDTLFADIESSLARHQLSLGPIKRNLEPATWQLLENPSVWGFADKQQLLSKSFNLALARLRAKFGEDTANWRWGNVNALELKHPFAKQIPQLGSWLNMPKVEAFGDSFMPAVQRTDFGASQRFIAQPGRLEQAIMAIPGGQSAHPLSAFYRAGYEQYATHQATPLLPGAPEHRLEIRPAR